MHEGEIPWEITFVCSGQLGLPQDLVNLKNTIGALGITSINTSTQPIIFSYRKYVWKIKKHAQRIYILK